MKDLRNGTPAVGIMLRVVGNPCVASIARHAGLDFVMLDMEHGSYSFETAAPIFSAARAVGLGACVRVPELSRGYVSRALDCGATGVMVPMLESVTQARDFVRWAKFPPVGRRGLSSAGGHTDYRCSPDSCRLMSQANAGTLTIAQIETRAAIKVIDGIAAVDGIDVLLIGPNDLAVSLGTPGDLDSPGQDRAIARVAAAARKHGKVFGMHAGVPAMRKWLPHGLRFLMHSLDINVLSTGFRQVNDDVRTLLQGPR